MEHSRGKIREMLDQRLGVFVSESGSPGESYFEPSAAQEAR